MVVAFSALAAAPSPASASAGRFAGTSDLTAGWKIQSSAVATGSGAAISKPGYSTAGWLPISRPETLMAGLVENGRYPDIFYSDNLASVPTDQFDVNWWYRDDVSIHPRPGQHTYLIINGVLSRANLWVDGAKVAGQSRLQGAYSRLEFDITRYVRDGANAIALDVFPNDTSYHTGYLTLDMVDWNQPSPDNWTGRPRQADELRPARAAMRGAQTGGAATAPGDRTRLAVRAPHPESLARGARRARSDRPAT